MPKPNKYGIQQLADVIGIGRHNIVYWIRTGKLPEPTLGMTKYKQWSKSEFETLTSKLKQMLKEMKS